MPSTNDRDEGAGPGVAFRSSDDASGDLQRVKFGSPSAEAQFVGLLSKGERMQVRLRPVDEQDVEGHLYAAADATVVLARVRIADDDDDVEGHAISIHFPDVERARRFRNELLAAGILTATVAMGVGTGIALAPSHQAGTTTSATQATVFMDTSAQAREGSPALAGTAGAASADTAAKAREAGATAASATPRHIPVGRHGATNPSAAAAAAQTAAGLHGSLAGSASGADASTKAREGGTSAASGEATNPAAAAAAAQTSAGLHGSLAGSASGTDASTKAREGGISAGSSDATNPSAAAAAAQTAAGLHGSLAGSASAADNPTKATGGSISERNAQATDKAAPGPSEDPTPQSGFNP